MNIRLAKVLDAASVAAIWNGMIRDTLATFTTVEKSTEDLKALIGERTNAFWIAEEDGQILGFASYGLFRAGPGYAATAEHTVILDPTAQRRGAGRALMQTLLDGAQQQGIHIMVAGISSANPDAVAFHTALGFEQTGHMPQVGRKAGQWLDLILMQKTLSAP